MVLATNKVSPFLIEALDSMQAQTYEAMEIVVVNDGCPQRQQLCEILDRYPDLVVIHHEPSGVAAARNVGVSQARGSLIGFFDDDDRYPSDWIENHVRAHSARPDVVLTYGDVRSIDAEGRELQLDRSRQGDIHDIFRRDVGIICGSLVVRRDTFIRVGGFNPTFRLAEDLDLVLRCAYEGPFGYMAGAARDYRTHGANVTRRHRELVADIAAIIEVHRASASLARRADLVSDLRVSRVANDRFAWWSAGRAARSKLRSGDLVAAGRELLWAIRVAPTGPLSWLSKRLSTQPR